MFGHDPARFQVSPRGAQSQTVGDRYLQGSRRTRHPSQAAVPNGGVLPRSAYFPAAVEFRRSAQGYPQEGKTTTSINCAVVLAQKGVRVLLIDADLRRPSIHKTLGMGPHSGLSNVLTGSTTTEQAITRTTILPNLFVLAAGTPPPNPAELLASTNMRDLLAQLREQYDHIVIDTPPSLSVTDAVVLSPRADAVVLVIRSGQTTKQALRRSRDVLTQVSANVVGVLLNAVDLSSPDYYYYYEYQGKYARYYREDDSSEHDHDEEHAVEESSPSSSSA
ncbi:MAG: hypothetical protein DMG79_20670 [Acidobacteria bacterium]|nr:MAG: hypothetical protein DMG79_20670 [Acidobacteriota bacterium]